ncbi:MAG: hypothetical protein HN704_14765 [Bacteroidetes bacterium]|jgi:phosphatidylglycerophosphate synthase|nr:hypothetical protein [Bacteroidota bacterium]MBT7492860.1 hypothetical protein [Bacteroidota bacterium]
METSKEKSSFEKRKLKKKMENMLIGLAIIFVTTSVIFTAHELYFYSFVCLIACAMMIVIFALYQWIDGATDYPDGIDYYDNKK